MAGKCQTTEVSVISTLIMFISLLLHFFSFNTSLYFPLFRRTFSSPNFFPLTPLPLLFPSLLFHMFIQLEMSTVQWRENTSLSVKFNKRYVCNYTLGSGTSFLILTAVLQYIPHTLDTVQ